MLLHPEVEIILFGNEPGTAEVASEYGLRHEPGVKRNEFGTILVNSVFAKAQEMARYDVVCYANCDIILMQDFREALERVRAARAEFLMVGRRWDLDIRVPLPFADGNWQRQLRNVALAHGKKRAPQYVDYFAFRRGLYGADLPPFAIGRTSWDNWLVWKALDSGKPVVDVSPVVIVVHQNHDYSHHPEGESGAWYGEEAQRNAQMLGGEKKLCTVESASYRLGNRGMGKNLRRWLVRPKRRLRRGLYRLWFLLLGITRPIRHRLGLRQRAEA